MNLAIIYGGSSSEREISLKTATSIIKFISNKYNIYSLDIESDYDKLALFLKENNIDLVFNALHGGKGENGYFQSFLERNKIKFTGSNSISSKIAMDKNKTKILCEKNLIPTPRWDYLDFNDLELNDINYNKIINKYKNSCVIKPADDGSSIGMTIIYDNLNQNKIHEGLSQCLKISKKIIIEEYIKGREFTVCILDGTALPIVEIIPKSEFYDFKSKYTSGECDYVIPAGISSSAQMKMIEYSLAVNKIIGCRHYSRVDLRMDESNIYILEINTLPGMTDTSLFPKAANADNLSYNKLIDKIIKLANR
tara:strand:+ start:890 stop:1816 length:927 start_codon:yes stop_codon:yes gene_type:complete